eukprot:SAG25_NODE_1138_length_3816_cov_4.312887_5_plen_46_part_00
MTEILDFHTFPLHTHYTVIRPNQAPQHTRGALGVLPVLEQGAVRV